MSGAARTHRLGALQILRAAGAVMIVLFHGMRETRSMAAMRHADFPGPALFLNAGVDVFFTISGFVMVLTSAGLFGKKGAARLFVSRRVARIVPTYWITTALFLALLQLSPDSVNSAGTSAGDVVRSLLFIPYGPHLDPVLKLGWTLNYEMFFYVCFSLVIFLPRLRAVFGLTVLFLALVVAGFVFPPAAPAFLAWTRPILLEFVAGAWIGIAYVRDLRIPGAAARALIVLSVGLILSGLLFDVRALGDRSLYWGGPAALLVCGCALGGFEPGRRLAPLVYVGDASFSLYLWHPFVLRVAKIGWLRAHALSDAGLAAYLAVSLAAAVGVACALYAFLEKPLTRRVRGWLGVGDFAPTVVLAGTPGIPP